MRIPVAQTLRHHIQDLRVVAGSLEGAP
jgi:hypothetical protein